MSSTTTTTRCASEDCTLTSAGKSKYCANHRREARERWRENVAATAAAREDRESTFRDLLDTARSAGEAAAQAAIPTPMIVTDERTGRVYEPVTEGVCGFAWVVVRPGTSSFARWLVKSGYGSKAYGGGIQIWVSGYGQSMTRKAAYADAFADVLRAAGITAMAHERMD